MFWKDTDETILIGATSGEFICVIGEDAFCFFFFIFYVMLLKIKVNYEWVSPLK